LINYLGEYPLTAPKFGAILLGVGDRENEREIAYAEVYSQGLSKEIS
jgi:hypothetical protein